eukprot:CAMPEP_0117502376 /NCGR_PEP_ID=MMETSP0784-20121206/23781_1 /TAXON_ID=39447 /ORGANISM="" /LENGTH=593 /DNA_ID=CAMNT_0005297657 /DNA_START=136 /DNA_END=1917 /DNA_ORIENTATION=+
MHAVRAGRAGHKTHLLGSKATRPNILLILVDDLGWNDASFNRNEDLDGIRTANIDALARDGVILDRHYVHKVCGPTRSAIQTGRAPIHVNVVNSPSQAVNPSDPIGGFQGIPRNMTCVAEVLRGVGYKTHMVGKWDVGMATPDHLPAARGYDTSLIYFNHDNDCWTNEVPTYAPDCSASSLKDLWEHDSSIPLPGRPAKWAMNGKGCTAGHQHAQQHGSCVFEDTIFEERVTSLIDNHDASSPFFVFWATRTVHGHYQPPVTELSRINLVGTGNRLASYYKSRRGYNGMITWLDGAVGRVVDLLRDKGLYDDTLIVFTSDNGAENFGDNRPLRGLKRSNWEGGIRARAFVSGGFVPQKARGSVRSGLAAVWDWYGTFAALAKADPTDHRAAEVGLPEVDSKDLWPFIIGDARKSPRTEIYIGSTVGGYASLNSGATTVGGMLLDGGDTLYKLVLGEGPRFSLECAAWYGPGSDYTELSPDDACEVTQVCGHSPENGCLFEVYADPEERKNLASQEPELFQQMLDDIETANRTVYSPDRGDFHFTKACRVGVERYGGFFGPFVDVAPQNLRERLAAINVAPFKANASVLKIGLK